jgi:hypothetical protein
MTFTEWMRAVDQEVEIVCGLGTSDLADKPYRDWFDDEYTPAEAAQELLEDEGFPF